MRHCRLSIAVLLVTVWISPASAGIFGKRSKPNPAERVPALIVTVRADPDEHKRSTAAEELRQYDPAMFPEIIPTLAEVAERDPKAGVRLEAIQSLAKIRPISHQAGLALEQAEHDDTMRVRMQARTLLFQYRLAGYRGAKTPDISAPENSIHTNEPPLAPASEAAPIRQIPSTIAPAPIVSVPAPSVSEAMSPVPGTRQEVKAPLPAVANGNVAKNSLRGPRQDPIRWAPAAMTPKALSPQPVAVPLEARSQTTGTVRIIQAAPRPSQSGPTKTATSGPRPLPTGPTPPASSGPKPLPEGPAESPVVPTENLTKEPPLSPPEEEGPDLSPP